MINHELNRRLLKRASYYNSFMYGVPSNEAIGSSIFEHAQNLGTIEPSDPRFRQYLETNGLDYATGMKSYELGQFVLQAMRDPTTADAVLNGNTEGLKNTAIGQQISQLISDGITIPGFEQQQGVAGEAAGSLGIPFGRVTNPDRIDALAAAVGRTPSGADFFDEQGNLRQPDDSWSTYLAPLAVNGITRDQAAKLQVFRNNPHLSDKVKEQFSGQIIKGMGQSFNRNSPLVRSGVSHLGTRYLENKINEWAPANSTIGGAFNSLGHWLLRLFSSMPGYESIMNWVADWKYGNQMKSLPGQIQNYGKNVMFPQVPYPNANTNRSNPALPPNPALPRNPALPPQQQFQNNRPTTNPPYAGAASRPVSNPASFKPPTDSSYPTGYSGLGETPSSAAK
jgi:hypothetical protein